MAEGGESYTAHDTELVTSNSQTESENKMDAVFDALLERTRSERLNELRQIENNNRPVTGQDHRNNINQFIKKNIEVRENVNAAQASGKENVPFNTSNVEEHRPEAVVIEIQGLSQQQRVSNTLQTAAFRRHLENIIRGSIRTVAQSHSPSSSHQPTPSPVNTPARAQTPVADAVSSVAERRDSVSSNSTTSSSSVSVDYNTRVQDPRGLLGAVLNNGIPPPPPPMQMPVQERPANVDWNIVEDMQQESLVQEVSELVHRRLVTSTLEGEFRNVLELHIRNRVDATGTDGRRVQEFIRSIPQSQHHVQNDFSNIGIPPPGENWETASITSISATAVPYTQTNLHMSREIASLKAQLQEMKNMMKVSFDLQMDIQRSIRQEVAAGIAAATAGNKDNATAPQTTVRSQPVNDTHCLICLDNHSDSVLYQCGHMCVCYPCGRHLMDRNAKCPVCRAPIRDIIRAYKCNQD
ncbi:uncharacterized protein LOC128559399 [Mercenaria mercenaria]|uniref:uncharacterized protein LOC128559399 n=1 Tax=Mercenaria mercenaria TaxID=6596 RepID=UPI00234F5553|nr:uncharacterized protein LOC128559399 [Mercenaria mercenaria]